MAINKIRQVAPFFAIVLLLFSSMSFVFAPKAYAVPDDIKTKDSDRRKLHASLRCLDSGVIDNDDDITDFEDMFDGHRWAGADKNSSKAEIALYGLDLTSNGVVTCKAALSNALNILGAQSDELGILKAMTKNKYSDFSKTFPGSDLNDGVADFKNRIVAKRDALQSELLPSRYYNYLLRERLKALIGVCYTVDGPPIDRSGLGDQDFSHTINDQKVNFYYKGDNEIRNKITTNNGGWYNDDGNGGRPTRIGDIQLSAPLKDTAATNDGVHPNTDGFYPMGDDRELLSKSSPWGRNDDTYNGIQTTKGLQACNLIKNEASWIFANDWKVGDRDITTVDPVSGDDTGGTIPAGGGAGGGGEDDKDSCESQGDLGWIICPVIKIISGAINKFEETIENQLEVNFDSSETRIRDSWARVRSISLILLVPIMLVMVMSSALGFDFIDAYTVKRTLPRLAIAVILISLSYPLMKFGINIFNSIGAGVKGLMLLPFGGEKDFSQIVGAQGGALISGAVIVGGFGLFLSGVGGFGVLFPLLAAAAIGLFLGFITLVVRQVILFFLIIIAPLAIVTWILPGTEKFWKLWWGTFTKLLFMYPLVMALIAAGQIGAYIIPLQQGSDGGFAFVLKLIAYVVPFFFIPATFKAGGAFFGALAGATMGSLSGVRKGLKERAGANRQAGWQRFTSGTGRGRLRNSNLVRRAGMGVGVGARGRFGFGETGAEARALLGTNSTEEALKNNPALQKLGLTDDEGNAVMALSGGTARGAEEASHRLAQSWVASGRYTAVQAEERRRRALAAATAVGFSRTNASAALATLAQNKSRAIVAGADGRALVAEGINNLHGRNSAAADKQRQEFAYLSSAAGRGDLGGTSWTSTSATGVGTASLDGFGRTGLYQSANGHQATITGAADDAAALLGTGQSDDIVRAGAFYNELGAMLPNATGAVRDEIIAQRQRLEAAGIGSSLGAQLIDPATGGPVTEQRRVSYDNTNPAHAGWSANDRNRGWRVETVNVTLGDRAREQARTYERPNPENI